ncbi:site-specific DNA-methyltransferase [Rickettsiales bacterium LUAb2]
MMLKIDNIINQIISDDCISVMQSIPSNSVDVIFADPPYFLQLNKDLYRPNNSKVKGVSEDWDKFESFTKYDEFTNHWLQEAQRVLKKNGTIWITGTYHNIFRIGKVMQDLQFWILNDVIWHKSNPMPNFKGVRFSNSHETIIWAKRHAKDKSHFFNYEGMKIFNDDTQMPSVWQMPICSGHERIKLDGKAAHPTQKPINLLKRVIISSTKVGDIILDPFAGTGTTCVAAKELARNFIGIEINKNYVEIAKQRLEKVDIKVEKQLLSEVIKPKYPRLSLANLIEASLINIGEKFYNEDEKIIAKVCVDGSLLYNKQRFSIHQLASETLGARTNGWNFWYYKNGKQVISINELRKNYFANIAKEQNIVDTVS